MHRRDKRNCASKAESKHSALSKFCTNGNFDDKRKTAQEVFKTHNINEHLQLLFIHVHCGHRFELTGPFDHLFVLLLTLLLLRLVIRSLTPSASRILF